ncbi:hypothetical protein GIB67_001659 [Kingdonia uniflora]|uniref:Protein ARV n=1 Tax=Kingdonia uniflora TaxID=39325 RepID=A0A7J7L0T5_9MAGN|nr:hypothetical protein GIB67_001659 [Kingdonia uniflora]
MICVQCGHQIDSLFVQYSPGNIRLIKCDKCKAIADDYIECEFMILFIDLILHKHKAYRHLLYNCPNLYSQGLFWKSGILYLLLDTSRRIKGELGFSPWVLFHVFFGNLMFISLLLVATKTFLNSSSKTTSYKDVFQAILVSSYLYIFLLPMMVWKFPYSVLFIVDIIVLSSNAVAFKVVTESTMTRCIWTCFSAHVLKFWASRMREFPLLGAFY